MNYEQYVSHSSLKNSFKDLCIIDPIHSGGKNENFLNLLKLESTVELLVQT